MHNRRLSGNAVADGDHSPHHETARAHTFRYQCPAHRPAQAHTAQCSVCGARCAPSLTPQESSKNLCQARFESFRTRPHRGRTLPAGCPPLSPNSQRHVCVCIMCKPHGSHWAPPSLVGINAMYLERSRERCHLQAVTRALACQCFVGVRWVADAADQASSTASIASMAMQAALARLRDWAPALARRQRHGTSMANAPNRTFMLVRFR
jgi:hypothetical protein